MYTWKYWKVYFNLDENRTVKTLCWKLKFYCDGVRRYLCFRWSASVSAAAAAVSSKRPEIGMLEGVFRRNSLLMVVPVEHSDKIGDKLSRRLPASLQHNIATQRIQKQKPSYTSIWFSRSSASGVEKCRLAGVTSRSQDFLGYLCARRVSLRCIWYFCAYNTKSSVPSV